MPPKPLPAPKTKTCKHCNTTFQRGTQPNGRPIERRKWLAQTYCSRQCHRDHKTKHANDHTKTCLTCGTTFQRPRHANGKLQSRTDWTARKYCTHECQNAAQKKHPTHKTCKACGITFERHRYSNGKLQSSSQWTKRVACSDACARELRKIDKPAPIKREPKKHAPCARCGSPVNRRAGERNGHWHARKYCTVACGQAASADHRRKLARERRGQRLAPSGYVFNGRFPTPKAVVNWTPVLGPDSGLKADFRHNTVTRSPKTLRMLEGAFGQHPDFLAAFAGRLSDSWVQQDAAG